MLPYTFVHFGGFLCIKDAGRRGNKITVLIFFIIMFDHCFASTCKISHERHKWNTFHIHVLNSTTNLTLIHKSYLWLWEWSCGFDRKESWSEESNLQEWLQKGTFLPKGTYPFYCENWSLYHLLHFVCAFWLVMTFLLTFLGFEGIVVQLW